jgi:hypothetical protein
MEKVAEMVPLGSHILAPERVSHATQRTISSLPPAGTSEGDLFEVDEQDLGLAAGVGLIDEDILRSDVEREYALFVKRGDPPGKPLDEASPHGETPFGIRNHAWKILQVPGDIGHPSGKARCDDDLPEKGAET